MELKELIREKAFAEIIAERNTMLLNQHEQIEGMAKEIAGLKAECLAKSEEIKKLQEV